MARTRTLTCLATVACAMIGAVNAPPSGADHGVPYESESLTRYFAIAAAHWGGPAPTCTSEDGQPIPVHAILYDDPDPGVSAMAELPGCRVWLDRGFWPARADQTDCVVIAHEWGHLLGHGHSQDESSLMYEAPFAGVPGCGVFADRAIAKPNPGRSRQKRARVGVVKHRSPAKSGTAKRRHRRRVAKRAARRGALRLSIGHGRSVSAPGAGTWSQAAPR